MSQLITTSTAIGHRLRLLRNLAGLKREDLANLSKVSKASISYWEHGRINSPIKSKSMAKVLAAFKEAGVEVKERWLRDGTGEPPKYKGQTILFNDGQIPVTPEFSNTDNNQQEDLTTQLANLLSDEIKLFTELQQAVIAKIDHDEFSPLLHRGDMVGGVWQDSSTLHEETLCIIKLNNKLTVRCVAPGTEQGLFDITYNKKEKLSDCALEKLAPIIRVWR